MGYLLDVGCAPYFHICALASLYLLSSFEDFDRRAGSPCTLERPLRNIFFHRCTDCLRRDSLVEDAASRASHHGRAWFLPRSHHEEGFFLQRARDAFFDGVPDRGTLPARKAAHGY